MLHSVELFSNLLEKLKVEFHKTDT